MAKQIGIHQIRGKVGGRSYYKTKGVESGVSRSINQGLSVRVNNSDEYANTRLNNSEFKHANAIATAAFHSVNTRKRGMMRNFAIAAMTKAALESIKQGTGNWGNRKPTEEMDQLICNLLENYAKGGVYDGKFGNISDVSFDSAGNFFVEIAVTEQISTNLIAQGIDGFYYIASNCLAGEILVDGEPRLFAGNVIGPSDDTVLNPDDVLFPTASGNLSTPSSVGMSQSDFTYALQDVKHGFYVCITFLPYRIEGDDRYVLQEHCTYVAVPLGQIPEE